MFSALNQGSLIHILDKTDGLKYKVGELVGFTQPNYGGAFTRSNFNSPTMTLKVKVDGGVQEYPDVPANQSQMSYNNGNVVISETVQGIQNEIESFYKHCNQILGSIDYYEKAKVDCETIMKEINPQFAKDKERDDRINTLDSKVTSIESKLDKILNAVANGNINSKS